MTKDYDVLTIGHSTRTLEIFIGMLQANGVQRVMDIRTVPRSRHNPQFNYDTLPDALNTASIGYLHMEGLGGLRHPYANSQNRGWRNSSFRGFADYMQTAEFEENLRDLTKLAGQEQIVLMCAESLPWRCHRSLIADALLLRGVPVEHILSKSRCQPHSLTPWAKVDGTHITYPVEMITTDKKIGLVQSSRQEVT